MFNYVHLQCTCITLKELYQVLFIFYSRTMLTYKYSYNYTYIYIDVYLYYINISPGNIKVVDIVIILPNSLLLLTLLFFCVVAAV